MGAFKKGIRIIFPMTPLQLRMLKYVREACEFYGLLIFSMIQGALDMRMQKQGIASNKIHSIVVVILILAILASQSSCRNNSRENKLLACSASLTGEIGDASSLYASISADGRYVAFESIASNLIQSDDTGNNGNGYDIYRKDLETSDIVYCSTALNGDVANRTSEHPTISGDGRYVAFQSAASNLVVGDTNSSTDIFRKDLATGEIIRCSISDNGEQGAGNSTMPSISADGRYIAFAFFGESFLLK